MPQVSLPCCCASTNISCRLELTTAPSLVSNNKNNVLTYVRINEITARSSRVHYVLHYDTLTRHDETICYRKRKASARAGEEITKYP